MVSEIKRKSGWMRASFRDYLKRMGRWIKTRKMAILVVLGWSVSVASVTIKSYLFVYIQEPRLFEEGMIYTTMLDWIPRLNGVDYLLIFAIGLISGALLADLERVFYGWIASAFLSFFIPVIFSSFFIWFSLGAGGIFSFVLGWALAIEVVSYLAFLIVFRMIFPIVPIFSLLAVFVGAFLRGMIQPSAGT